MSLDTYEKMQYDSDYPSFYISIYLSSRKNEIERQVYSVFTLLGDFGGFNGAIVMFPSYHMSFYSARMFNS